MALNARTPGINKENKSVGGCTHFAMIHNDIIALPGWLDKMLALAEKHDADILSVISPIKDERGLTSFALDEEIEPGNGGLPVEYAPRRLTLTEIYDNYPETFEVPGKLLINTGLMLVRLKNPLTEELYFAFDDKIIKQKGKFIPVGISEDWFFSRLAQAKGLKVFATREIKLNHAGRFLFGNEKWGTWDKDKIA